MPCSTALLLALLLNAPSWAEPLHWSGQLDTSPPTQASISYAEPEGRRLLELELQGAEHWLIRYALAPPFPGERRETLSVSHDEDEANTWTLVQGDLTLVLPAESNSITVSQSDVMLLAGTLRREARAAHRGQEGSWKIEPARIAQLVGLIREMHGTSAPKAESLQQAEPARSVEERACPRSREQHQFANDRHLSLQPSLLCYSEPHDGLGATVYFAVEGSQQQDPWGRYTRLLRQLMVTWQRDDRALELVFVTDPKSDPRGITLLKREGSEVLVLRRSAGDTALVDRWFLVSGLDQQGVFAEEGNTAEVPHREVQRLMERLRRSCYSAASELEGYLVEGDAPITANPTIIEDDRLRILLADVEALLAPTE